MSRYRYDLVIVVGLIAAHVLLRTYLLPQVPNEMVANFSDVISSLYLDSPFSLLGPIPISPAGDRVHWTTTGLVLTEGLRTIIGLNPTYILASGLLIVVSYWAARDLSASRSVAVTYAALFLFGNQLNYTFVHTHVGTFYWYYLYLTVNLFSIVKFMIGPRKHLWLACFALSLVFIALFLEIWLNYALFLLAFLPVLAAWFYRRDDAASMRAAFWCWGIALVVAVAYVLIRFQYGSNLSVPGSEDEIITKYRHFSLAIEDFISNVLTYIYMCFATYTPLIGSYSLVHLGGEEILKEQNGWGRPFQEMVYYHHVFLWYYAAGIVFTIFAGGMFSSFRRAMFSGSQSAILVFGILILILTGCASHSLIKYRYYNSFPILAYKVVTGTFGVAVLAGFAVDWVRRRASVKLYRTVLAATWLAILLAFVTHSFEEIELLKIIGLVDPTTKPNLQWSR